MPERERKMYARAVADSNRPGASDCQLGSLSTVTLRCITFDDLTLRRGMRASSMMSRFGCILQNSKGSEETFKQSMPVDSIDVFVSHNWSTPRYIKFLAMTLHFNFKRAVCVAAVSSLLLGVVPRLTKWTKIQSVPYFLVEHYMVFMFTLLCGHHVCRCNVFRCCGFFDPVVFLDKTCIHQTDLDLQRKGIASLSAYLNSSEKMLIIYTSAYMQRLWTVYELASMLVLRPAPRITVVPTHMVWFLYASWALTFLHYLASALIQNSPWMEHSRSGPAGILIPFAPFVPLSLPMFRHIRRWARERSRMHALARKFCIRSAVCAVESDRETVHRNISCIMRDFGFVPVVASEQSALNAFDQLVRNLVPFHLDKCFGRFGLPYRYAATLAMPKLMEFLDFLYTTQHNAIDKVFVMNCISPVISTFAIGPIFFALCSLTMGQYLQLKGLYDKTFLLAGWFIMVAILASSLWGFDELRLYANNSETGLGIYLAVVCVLVILTFVIYKPPADSVAKEDWHRRFGLAAVGKE